VGRLISPFCLMLSDSLINSSRRGRTSVDRSGYPLRRRANHDRLSGPVNQCVRGEKPSSRWSSRCRWGELRPVIYLSIDAAGATAALDQSSVPPCGSPSKEGPCHDLAPRGWRSPSTAAAPGECGGDCVVPDRTDDGA
jgi:hypothetical protein